jgi:hypothetical protein
MQICLGGGGILGLHDLWIVPLKSGWREYVGTMQLMFKVKNNRKIRHELKKVACDLLKNQTKDFFFLKLSYCDNHPIPGFYAYTIQN